MLKSTSRANYRFELLLQRAINYFYAQLPSECNAATWRTGFDVGVTTVSRTFASKVCWISEVPPPGGPSLNSESFHAGLFVIVQ